LATSTSKGLLKQAKLSNTLQIIWMVIVVIGFFIGSFYGSKLMGIYPTKDTINIPGSFDLQNEGNEMSELSEAFLNFKISGTGVMYGGCIPYSPGSGRDACIAAGYIDKGCGWNEETRCNCNSNQQGCFGEKAYYPSDVKLSCGGKSVPYTCSGGACKTNNFADAFPKQIPQDWIMSCSVSCGGSGQLTSVTLDTTPTPINVITEKWIQIGYTCIKTTNYEGIKTYETELDCVKSITLPDNTTTQHLECLNNACVIIEGEGNNTCNQNSQCSTPEPESSFPWGWVILGVVVIGGAIIIFNKK
jgi:hypothetical protein